MRILIVEDERPLADGLADGLRREGHAVEVEYDGAAAFVALGRADFDVVLLDRDLPVLSGDAVCSTLRAQGNPVRVLMLTAAGTLDDRVAGLDLGADDYLTKPFAYVELLARLRALGRRVTAVGSGTVLDAGGVRIDTVRLTAERDGRPLRLTPKEYGVLEVLLAARGAWLSVDEIVEEVWEQPEERRRTVVKATIHTLRRKLGDPDPIESAAGFGYRIPAPSDAGAAASGPAGGPAASSRAFGTESSDQALDSISKARSDAGARPAGATPAAPATPARP